MGGPNSSKAFVSSSTVRSRLLEHLVSGPKTPTELASMDGKHVSHVSRALAELKERGLVEQMSSASRERYYKATSQGMSIYTTMLKNMK
ncbi:MAG TPA: winged helix-turn-helix domain-containing protein [Nitrososphaerales archaeon]|jgi:predicted transcriptional regulator|nr:winged helix-turn-helix domain-containing protein [Nitrososphaerales archaeon]